jgi:hypothetical protein
MSPPPDSSPPSSVPPLPKDFKTVEEIQNLPNDQVKAGLMVSMVGFVTDYQPPFKTNGPGMPVCL